ncbi:MAG: CocE/NonD family hydrolase [Acidobacteriota bacterium]
MKHILRHRLFRLSFILCAIFLFNFSTAVAQIRKISASVTAQGGDQLVTEVYLPEEEKKYPCILIRTPYGGNNLTRIGEAFANAGYAVVIQNVRGTGGSGGRFLPFVFEMNDGLTTLDWVNIQSWSNGKVGVWGASYLGYCGLLIASSGNPSIVAGINISGWSDLKSLLWEGGAFRFGDHLPWLIFQMSKSLPPPDALDRIFRTVPINSILRGADKQIGLLAGAGFAFDRINIPVLHVTGWYDYLYGNTLSTYSSIRNRASKPAMQKLIIGTWPHNDVFSQSTRAGDEDFGSEARMGFDKMMALSIRWFDHYLKGIDDSDAREPSVKYFVMGENRWREAQEWPPRNVKCEKWYLHSKGAANGLDGSGQLLHKPPCPEGSDQFIYDPSDPVPTFGGANSHFLPAILGVKDQRQIEQRKDVLIYTSPPFDKTLTLVGPLRAVIYASTEGKDTDFTAKLVEVRPDGYARIIEEGILRGRTLLVNGAKYLTPGQVYKFEIEMGATAIQLRRGSRVRLEVSSSNFPKYDRNPSTGEDPILAKDFKAVRQTVYHSSRYPSHVLLPVMK